MQEQTHLLCKEPGLQNSKIPNELNGLLIRCCEFNQLAIEALESKQEIILVLVLLRIKTEKSNW